MWNHETLNILDDIINIVKKGPLGEVLEYIADYYIKQNKLDMDKYSLNFSVDCIDPDISDGTYKLAFLCDSVNKKKRKKVKDTSCDLSSSSINRYNPYECLAYIIRHSVYKLFRLEVKKLNYKELYLIDILKRVVYIDETQTNNLKQKIITESFTVAYFLVTEVKKICDDTDIIHFLPSLHNQIELIDLNILTTEQLRSILNILNTKRTIYVRVLLILTFELLKEVKITDSNWLVNKIQFTDKITFLDVTSNPIVEIVLASTAYTIANNK